MGPAPAPGCDEPTSRCQTLPSIWTLGQDQPVIPGVAFIRYATALPPATVGSLSPTFVPARPVCLAVKLPCAFARPSGLPSRLREPLSASGTLWEATAPVKLSTSHGSPPGFTDGVRWPHAAEWYFTGASTAPASAVSLAPTYPTQHHAATNGKLESSSTGSFCPGVG